MDLLAFEPAEQAPQHILMFLAKFKACGRRSRKRRNPYSLLVFDNTLYEAPMTHSVTIPQ